MTTAKTFSQQALTCRVVLLEHNVQEASHLLDIMSPAGEQQELEKGYLQAWLAGVEQEWHRLTEGVKPLLMRYHIIESEEGADFGDGQVVAVRCWFRLGQIALALGLPRDAQSHLEGCLTLLHQRRLAEHDVRAEAAVLLAKATLEGGAPLRAIPFYQTALAVCQRYQNTSLLPDLYAGLSEAYQRTGQLEEAIQSAQCGLACSSALGRTITADHYFLLGDLYWRAERAAEAIHAYRRVLALQEANSPHTSVVYASMLLVALQFQYNERSEFEEWARKAEQSLVWTKDPRETAYVLSALGCFASEQAARETNEEAALKWQEQTLVWHEKAVEELLGLQSGTELAEYCMRAALVLEDLGRMQEAHVYAKQAASLVISK